jgi:hypothetical protein
VVAEPGELAEKFLQSVKFSLLSTMRSHRRKGASLLANVSTISDLVAFKPYFQLEALFTDILDVKPWYIYILVLLYKVLKSNNIFEA